MDLQKGNLRGVLEQMDAPTVASAVNGSKDYPRILQELEDMLTSDYAKGSRTDALRMAS
jgi:hypothetical protein